MRLSLEKPRSVRSVGPAKRFEATAWLAYFKIYVKQNL